MGNKIYCYGKTEETRAGSDKEVKGGTTNTRSHLKGIEKPTTVEASLNIRKNERNINGITIGEHNAPSRHPSPPSEISSSRNGFYLV